jgi:hypothetical protein
MDGYPAPILYSRVISETATRLLAVRMQARNLCDLGSRGDIPGTTDTSPPRRESVGRPQRMEAPDLRRPLCAEKAHIV